MPEQDQNQTAGTPAQDDGDAAETQTAGTPESDGRDAGGEPDYKALFLAFKGQAEAINQLREQVEQINRGAQSPAAPAAETTWPDQTDWEDTADLARQGNPLAKTQIALRQALWLLNGDTKFRTDILEVEDKGKRARIRDYMDKNRSRGLDIKAAEAEIDAEELRKSNDELREQLAEAQRAKPRGDVVRTGVLEVPASEARGRQMKASEAQDEIARLQSEDPARAMSLQRDIRLGKIILTH